MTTKVETITPKIANEILEQHNPRNRTISEGAVSAYATDMKNGRWTLTHQGIAFDENGDLIDGQHRLWAVIFSDKEIEFMVTRGIPIQQAKNGIVINSMDNVDRGRQRGIGSQMQLCHGIKNGNCVAAACRSIASMVSAASAKRRVSLACTLFIYEQYGKDIETMLSALDSQHRKQYILGPLGMYHHGEPVRAIEFARQLVTLENLSAPVRVAVKWLEAKHCTANSDPTLRVICKCIHHFHDGTPKLERVTDDSTGITFLASMFPSLNRRISDQIKPVPAPKIPRNLKRSNEK